MFLMSLGLHLVSNFSAITEAECKRLSDIPQTQAAKADIKEIEKNLKDLRDLEGRKFSGAFEPELKVALTELFSRDADKVSKLEQFYGLLWLIARYKDIQDRRVDFNPADVKKILLAAKVFSTPEVPNSIASVTLFWSKAFKKATYAVKFDKEELRLSLNQGKGFATYREGLCQVAEELVFYGGFEFDVESTRKENFYVSNFKEVDLFGKFGSRGMVDVDINYVSVKSVEFLKGSPFGIVRAKVSRREFQINQHSVLLRMVTNFVTDKSTQPIDW